MAALKNVQATLDELRQRIGAVDGTPKGESFAFSLFQSGLRKGTVVEIVGFGKTEFLTQFLGENADLKIAWVEPELTVYPFAFLQRDVDLSRILFVETEKENMWSTLQILQAQLFQVVVVSFPQFHERNLRKIQLAAEKAQAIVVLLNKEAMGSWIPAVQLHVERQGCKDFHVRSLRRGS